MRTYPHLGLEPGFSEMELISQVGSGARIQPWTARFLSLCTVLALELCCSCIERWEDPQLHSIVCKSQKEPQSSPHADSVGGLLRSGAHGRIA